MISSCELDRDFSDLPKNDLTKLDTLSSALSESVKARISLARCLYKKDSKIILIDGSFSYLSKEHQNDILELCKHKIVFAVIYDME